jgi:pimeloyl-ACP methyl ester carboxylesterase
VNADADGKRGAIGERRVRYAGFSSRELFVAGTGPCVVLIHGYGDSADTWRGVLAKLAERGCAAGAVDLPGFGHADARRRGAQLPQLDAFVAELVAAHAETGVVAVGNSLGGTVVLRAAQRHDLPIRAVMAMGSAGSGFTPGVRLIVYRNGWLVRAACAVPVPPILLAAGIRRALPGLLYGDPRLADPTVVQRMSAGITDSSGLGLLARGGAMFAEEVRNCLEPGRVRCPAVILQGARDRLVPVAAARRLHAALPHSELVVLPGVGHCPQLDAPGAVSELVIELIERTAPAADASNRPDLDR